jgi:ABC-type lipoprotein export system ATPase subunit
VSGGEAGARVVVRDVRRVHPGPIVALDGLSLTLEPGDFTALTGPSGSGKTSLLSLIGALDRPTTGTVEVNGELVSDGGDHSRYRRELVGFVLQDHYLLPDLTAGANVELPQKGPGSAGASGRRGRASSSRRCPSPTGSTCSPAISWRTSRPGRSTRSRRAGCSIADVRERRG